MSTEMIDTICLSCHKTNLLLKQPTKGNYRCGHCQSQFSGPFASLTLRTQPVLHHRKMAGFSVLFSIGLFLCFVRSALGSTQPLSIIFRLSQSQIPQSPLQRTDRCLQKLLSSHNLWVAVVRSQSPMEPSKMHLSS
jgi:hypothetical protein